MNQVFSTSYVFGIAIAYALVMAFLTYLVKGYAQNKVGFLVAKRKLGMWEAALSIAATWVWAPALFMGAQQAYINGWVGVFWFVVPNVLCLIIFAWFADSVRRKLPEGFTFSEFIRNRFSKRCHTVYVLQFVLLAVCSFAVQILAGASVIKTITGLPFFWGSVLLTVVSLSYTLFAGVKVSVLSDVMKMVLIFFLGLPLIAVALFAAGGMDSFVLGWGGKDGNLSLFSDAGAKVCLTFGLPTAIGLLAGPFGDQAFWQRAFAIKEKKVVPAFMWSALFFGIVPLAFSVLGFLAAGTHLAVPVPQNTNLYAVIAYTGSAGVLVFLVILMAGLIGTLDSRFASLASLAGHDFLLRMAPKEKRTDKLSLKYSRVGMLILAVLAVGIANIPHIEILYLFLIYGQIRAATLLPTVLAIVGVRLNERGVFWGVVTSFVVGLPMFAWGNINKEWQYIVSGTLFTVFASAIIAILVTHFCPSKDETVVSDGALEKA